MVSIALVSVCNNIMDMIILYMCIDIHTGRRAKASM